MQKKSESWCTWLVSRMKSLICLREHKQTSKHLDMKHLGKLLDIGPLEALPDNQFNSVIKYLDAKSLLRLGFSGKGIKKKIDELNKAIQEYDTKKCHLKENYENNLLRCVEFAMLYMNENLWQYAYVNTCIDYKMGEKFDIGDNKVLSRTLYDFVETFIESKSRDKYKLMINNAISGLSSDNEKFKLIKDIFKAGSFTDKDIKQIEKKYVDNFNEIANKKKLLQITYDKYMQAVKHQKQIQNYKQITGKSYKSIYEHIKNNPDPKKPERENYIKAYEELKKEEGGCSIF